MLPNRLTPPWHAATPEGLIKPEYLAEPLLFDSEGSSAPPGGPPWAAYDICLWPHELLIWPTETNKPTAAAGVVIVSDRQLALSREARLWCAAIVDFGKGVVLRGRSKGAVESGSRLIEMLFGGAGRA